MRFFTIFLFLTLYCGLYAQNMGVKLPVSTLPNATLDVNGSTAFREGTALTLANGSNNDITLGDYSFYRILGPTAAFSITGFGNGQNGRVLFLMNATAHNMTLNNLNASSTLVNRINTGSNDNLTLAPSGSVTLIYNATLQKWAVFSKSGELNKWDLKGNAGTTPGTHFIGTTDPQSLVFKTNGSEGMRLNTSGNLGIGTSAPDARLNILGGDIMLGTVSPTMTVFPDSSRKMVIRGDNGSNTDDVRLYNYYLSNDITHFRVNVGDDDVMTHDDLFQVGNIAWTDNVWRPWLSASSLGLGIGTLAPTSRLTVTNNGKIADVPSDAIAQFTNADDSDTEVLIDAHGNGINNDPALVFRRAKGTATTPTAVQAEDALGRLSWWGHNGTNFVDQTAKLEVFAAENWSATANGSKMQFNTTANGTTLMTPRMTLSDKGFLGIGLVNPSSKLEIATGAGYDGITLKSSTATNGTYLKVDGNTNVLSNTPPLSMWIDNKENADIAFSTNNSVRLWVKANGNVGIGCNAPNYPLQVTGDIAASGTLRASSAVVSTAFTACSDSRFKQNITPLSNTLQNVLKLQGVTYDWRVNEFPDRHFNERKQIGVIAQELEKIYPELVSTDDKGYKSVDYSKMTPILVEAIKDLKQENDALKSELEKLKSDFKSSVEKNIKDIESIKAMLEKKF
jgi:hypothetical protein